MHLCIETSPRGKTLGSAPSVPTTTGNSAQREQCATRIRRKVNCAHNADAASSLTITMVLATTASKDCPITGRPLALSVPQLMHLVLQPSPKGFDQDKLPSLQQTCGNAIAYNMVLDIGMLVSLIYGSVLSSADGSSVADADLIDFETTKSLMLAKI
eukprot:IDg11925t1